LKTKALTTEDHRGKTEARKTSTPLKTSYRDEGDRGDNCKKQKAYW
jgi:hypothetical protein